MGRSAWLACPGSGLPGARSGHWRLRRCGRFQRVHADSQRHLSSGGKAACGRQDCYPWRSAFSRRGNFRRSDSVLRRTGQQYQQKTVAKTAAGDQPGCNPPRPKAPAPGDGPRAETSGTRKNRFSICTARSGSSTLASRYRSAARMPASSAARTGAASTSCGTSKRSARKSPRPAGNRSGCAMRHSD